MISFRSLYQKTMIGKEEGDPKPREEDLQNATPNKSSKKKIND